MADTQNSAYSSEFRSEEKSGVWRPPKTHLSNCGLHPGSLSGSGGTRTEGSYVSDLSLGERESSMKRQSRTPQPPLPTGSGPGVPAAGEAAGLVPKLVARTW